MTRSSARSRYERRKVQARPKRSARLILSRIVITVIVFSSVALVAALLGIWLARPTPISTPATLGTADHWTRIADGSTVDDELLLSDGSGWALFNDGYTGRLDGDHWATMSDKVNGSLLIELPGKTPRLLVAGGTKTAWQTADHGSTWQPVTLPLNLPTRFTAPNVTQQTALWLVGRNPPAPDAIWLAASDGLTHYDAGSDTWRYVPAPAGWQLTLSNAVIAADGSIWVGATPISAAGSGTTATPGAASVGNVSSIPTAWWRFRPGAAAATPSRATATPTAVSTAAAASDLAGTWLKSAYMPRDSFAFVSEPGGALWLILTDGRLARLPAQARPDQGVNWQLFSTADRAGSSTTAAAMLDSGAADRDGTVWWIGRDGSLYHYDGQHWQAYPAGSAGAPLAHPLAPFVTDRDGHLWLGGDTLARYAAGRWSVFDPAHGDPFGAAMPKSYQDVSGRPLARDGSLWIAVSAAGLVRFNDSGWTWFGPQNKALPMPASAGVSDRYVPLSSAPDGSLLVYHPIEGATYYYHP